MTTAAKAATTMQAAPVTKYNYAVGYLRGFIVALVVAHHSALAYHPYAPPQPSTLLARPRWWMAFPIAAVRHCARLGPRPRPHRCAPLRQARRLLCRFARRLRTGLHPDGAGLHARLMASLRPLPIPDQPHPELPSVFPGCGRHRSVRTRPRTARP